MDGVESPQSNEVSETGDDIDKIKENNVESPENAAVTENDSSAEKSVDVVMADNPADSECFKHFDVLQCPPDHHYLESTAQVNSFTSLSFLCYLFVYSTHVHFLNLIMKAILLQLVFIVKYYLRQNIVTWRFVLLYVLKYKVS